MTWPNRFKSLLANKYKSSIIGATKIDHLTEIVDSLEIKLSSDDIKRLEEKYIPHQITGHH